MQKINSFSNCPVYNYETQANIKSVYLKKNTPQLFSYLIDVNRILQVLPNGL